MSKGGKIIMGAAGAAQDEALRGDRPIRIMHVFGGHVRSGVETVVLTLTRGLLARGHQIVLVPLGESGFIEEARALGLDVRPLAKRGRYDVLSIPRLAALIRDYRPEILHSHAVNGIFYASPAARLAGRPAHVSHFHVDTAESLADVYRWQWPRICARRYHFWLAGSCSHLITVNAPLRQDLLRHGIPADKVTYVPNAVDGPALAGRSADRDRLRRDLQLPPDAFILGAACRLAPFKNLPMLLRVAAAAMREDKRVYLVLVGDGSERDKLESLADELGIRQRVRLPGWRTDVLRFISLLDLYLITSNTEGLSMSGLEAMAMGIPVISTDVGGMKEIVKNGTTGFLVEPGDEKAMTSHIRTALRDPDLLRKMGASAANLVRSELGGETMVGRVERIYRQALAGS